MLKKGKSNILLSHFRPNLPYKTVFLGFFPGDQLVLNLNDSYIFPRSCFVLLNTNPQYFIIACCASCSCVQLSLMKGGGGEMVDAADLKSAGRQSVWVRIPPAL